MRHPHDPESLDILGVPVNAFASYREAEEWIVQRIADRQKTFCAAISSGKIQLAQRDRNLGQLFHAADLHICDGVAIALAALILHRQRIPRITGVQLFLHLIARAAEDGLKVFLLGAKPASNEGACRRLLEMHPRLQVVGRQDGYFQEDGEVVRRINQSGADMLFVAMGSPRQEQWIHTHRRRLAVPFCMGVGGTFDVVSGHAKWAPPWVRRLGMEWIYRTIQEPRTRLPRVGRDVLFGLRLLRTALTRR